MVSLPLVAAPRAIALTALALVAGCPIDPAISPLNLSCTSDSDCGGGTLACISGTCSVRPGGINGGSSGGTSGDAGLCQTVDGGLRQPGDGGNAFACLSDQDCACGFSCRQDHDYNVATGNYGALCLQPCATTNDCTYDRFVCWGGFCKFAICGRLDAGLGETPTLPIPFYAPCTLDAPGDSLCVPIATTGPSGLYGYCIWGGDAGPGSPCAVGEKIPTITCSADLYCAGSPGAEICVQLCDPDGGGSATGLTCAAGQNCQPLIPQLPVYTCQDGG